MTGDRQRKAGRKGILLLGLLVASVAMAADDPIVGTWVLDLKKSTIRPGPPPRSQTRVYRESNGGITATIVTLTADGKTTTIEFPMNYDGHPHAVKGPSDYDAIEMKRITPFRSEATLLHGERVLAKSTREVSGNSVLTIVLETTSGGSPVRSTYVYNRQ